MNAATELKTLKTGVMFGESPWWHDGRLWFCDWVAGEVIAVDLDGHSEVVARIPSFPFCIDFDADGNLLIISGRQGLVLKRASDGSLQTQADLTSLHVSTWNEITVDARGNAYVNGGEPPSAESRTAGGIVALVTPDGASRKVAEGIAFPNGMAAFLTAADAGSRTLSAANATLIVADSYARQLIGFDIAADGSLANRHVWADLGDGVPDGICLDAEGAVWYADVPNQRCVRVREGGEVLQTIHADQGCFSCALGGPERRTLFIVTMEWRGFEHVAEVAQARTGRVLAVDVPVPGLA